MLEICIVSNVQLVLICNTIGKLLHLQDSVSSFNTKAKVKNLE